jgi:multiple sugar transport system permease protein
MTAHTVSSSSPGAKRNTTASGSDGANSKTVRRAGRRWSRRQLLPYALILPALLFELLVHIGPMLLGVWISFRQLTQLTIRRWTSAPFAGLDNYWAGLDPSGTIGHELLASLVRTSIYTAIVLAVVWVLAIFAAVLCNSSFRGRGFFRTFFLLPYVLPSYVVVIGWAFMFNQQNGMINHLLVDNLHLLDSKPFWLIGDRAFWVTVVVNSYHLWPFAFLMLLAALQNIPNDLYEAAALDGASLWRQFRDITLPMIRHVNGVVLLMVGLWTFNQINIPYLLFGPRPPASARMLAIHIYENSFVNWNFGLGSAMSTMLLFVLMAFSVLYVRLVLPKEQRHA